MRIQPERGRFDYFKADIVQPEKGMEAAGRFLGQMRDSSGRYDRVSQFDQKMKKIILMTVFHIVKAVHDCNGLPSCLKRLQ